MQEDNRLVVAKGVRGEKGMDWELGVRRCKLLHLEMITTKSYCIAQGTVCSLLGETMMEKNIKVNVHN